MIIFFDNLRRTFQFPNKQGERNLQGEFQCELISESLGPWSRREDNAASPVNVLGRSHVNLVLCDVCDAQHCFPVVQRSIVLVHELRLMYNRNLDESIFFIFFYFISQLSNTIMQRTQM